MNNKEIENMIKEECAKINIYDAIHNKVIRACEFLQSLTN